MEDRKIRRTNCKIEWKRYKKENKKMTFGEFWRKYNKSIRGMKKCRRK